MEPLIFFYAKVDLLWGKLKKRDQQLATWPGKLKKVVQEAV